MPNYLTSWAAQSAKLDRASRPKKVTPEGAVLKAVMQALKLWRIGTVRRINTGALEDRTGRTVRFGEIGHSDLVVELPDGRNAYIEVKAPDWKPMTEPRPGSAVGTWRKWRHQCEQDAFLARQAARGCPSGYVTSVASLEAFLAKHGLRRTA